MRPSNPSINTHRFRIAAVYINNDNLLGPTSRRFLLEEDSNTQRPEVPPTITSLLQESDTIVRARWSYNPIPGIPVEGFFIHYRESTVAGSYTKVGVAAAVVIRVNVSSSFCSVHSVFDSGEILHSLVGVNGRELY